MEDQIQTNIEATTTPDTSSAQDTSTTQVTESKVVEPEVHESKLTDNKEEKPKKSEAKKEPKNLKEHFENLAKEKALKAEKLKSQKDLTKPADTTLKPEAKTEPKADKFTPNFKFKVKDKEYEIPQWARTAITTKEAEKEFVDLFTKAEGLEAVKVSREQAIQDKLAAESERDNVKNYASEVLSYRDSKQWDKFYKHLKVSDRDIVEHALSIVERNNLPPEQKELYNQIQAKDSAYEEQEMRFQEMQKMWQQTAAHAKAVDLNSSLAKAENSRYAETYESVNGLQPGAFRQRVIDYGDRVYQLTGKDLSAEEAIEAVKSELGKGYFPQEKPQETTTTQTTLPVVNKELPVIPNIQGKNISHIQKPITRVADLKRISKEKFG